MTVKRACVCVCVLPLWSDLVSSGVDALGGTAGLAVAAVDSDRVRRVGDVLVVEFDRHRVVT